MRICNTMISSVLLACGLLLATEAARAHYLWLEADESEARVFYGEAEGDLREKSPGKLDSMNVPRVVAVQGNTGPLPVSRGAGHFTVAGANSTTTLLATEESSGIRDLGKYGLGMAKSNYYARYGRPQNNESEASLVLDVAGSTPNQLTVFYRGRPLKNAKVEVIAPNTWVQEHKTDALGSMVINTPWRGRYVIHVLHVDQVPGSFEGKRYDSLRNHFTYSFVKTEGADPGPAVPPRQGAD